MTEVLVIGSLWFASSAVVSTYANTAFLKEFDSPLAHTVVRFTCSALIGLLTAGLQPQRLQLLRTLGLMWSLRLPAMLLLVANLLNSVALRLSGITLCYVCKSGIPVFTVCLMSMQGQYFPAIVYASLMPTVLGVALASASDLDFSLAGLVAALGSALSQTLLNITSKRLLKELHVSGRQAQFLMASCCAVAALPLYLLNSERAPVEGKGTVLAHVASVPWSGAILVLAGVAYHVEYMLNFMFMPFVSPLAFSITDIARRLTIIVAGAIFFSKDLTALNVIGILLALGGVLWYSVLGTAPPQLPKTSPNISSPAERRLSASSRRDGTAEREEEEP
mmetsp:Transcript_19331/g.58094  ORF Transcript_19331/g.58094 Transcript_19331/m.58094 type:complete len:335 (+) Transcript_19331:206-1210(+)